MKAKKKKQLKGAKKALSRGQDLKAKMVPEQQLITENQWGNTEKNSYPGVNGSEDLVVP